MAFGLDTGIFFLVERDSFLGAFSVSKEVCGWGREARGVARLPLQLSFLPLLGSLS